MIPEGRPIRSLTGSKKSTVGIRSIPALFGKVKFEDFTASLDLDQELTKVLGADSA
jgi:hypothetical protein